jgi:hypothetical protein
MGVLNMLIFNQYQNIFFHYQTPDREQVYVTKPVFSSNGGVLAALFHALVFAWCQVL